MRRLSDNLADISLDFEERRSSKGRGTASSRVDSELRRVSDDLANFQFDADDLAMLSGARASTSGSDALMHELYNKSWLGRFWKQSDARKSADERLWSSVLPSQGRRALAERTPAG